MRPSLSALLLAVVASATVPAAAAAAASAAAGQDAASARAASPFGALPIIRTSRRGAAPQPLVGAQGRSCSRVERSRGACAQLSLTGTGMIERIAQGGFLVVYRLKISNNQRLPATGGQVEIPLPQFTSRFVEVSALCDTASAVSRRRCGAAQPPAPQPPASPPAGQQLGAAQQPGEQPPPPPGQAPQPGQQPAAPPAAPDRLTNCRVQTREGTGTPEGGREPSTGREGSGAQQGDQPPGGPSLPGSPSPTPPDSGQIGVLCNLGTLAPRATTFIEVKLAPVPGAAGPVVLLPVVR